MQRILKRLAALLVLSSFASALAASSSAQEWANKLFGETRHDFGTVAKGSQAVHRFSLENIYEEDVHIVGVRTSCNCVAVEVSQSTLKTWEKGEIVARLKTDSYLGKRSATITVVIDRPYRAEVQLGVNGFIRQDVILNPGTIRFGNVDQGTAKETVLDVTHTGRNDWQITDVRSANQHLDVSLTETGRTRGRVGYRLTVRLKPEAPTGIMSDEIKLVTNDRENQLITVALDANIVPALTASPRLLAFGSVAASDSATLKLVLRGKEAFEIKDVRCEDSRFQATSDGRTAAIQVVPITLQGDGRTGRVDEVIQVLTSAGMVSVKVQADFTE